jgi:NAD+ synthase (glutamine-hydrolysing)
MPGFGTSGRTYNNAINLMNSYGVTIKEVSIREASLQHFKDIGLDPSDRSVTYENTQARERTQILMDIANLEGGLVIGTGDLSELILGWCTYNGDHMSMYSVNGNIPKTLVRYLVKYFADEEENDLCKKTILDILETPISPELLPPSKDGSIAQQTESVVGPYVLHDFFLYHFMRYGATPEKIKYIALQVFDGMYSQETIDKWLKFFIKRFFNQQFKRSCLPDGIKVGTIGVSPRGDLRLPSDADSNNWLNI